MIALYDSEQVMHDYVASEKREASIRTTINLCREFGCSTEEIVKKIAHDFNMSIKLAHKTVKMY